MNNNGIVTDQQRGKKKTKLLVDIEFSLGTNKLVGSRPLIKRIIFYFASITQCFEDRGHGTGHSIQSELLSHRAHRNLRAFVQ